MPKNESATPKSYDRAREMTEKALDAFVEGDENAAGKLRKGKQPCVGPQFGRSGLSGGARAKRLLDLEWFGDEGYAVILIEPVIDSPGFGERQRLPIHGCSRGHETEEAHLREAAECNGFSLVPPAPGSFGMDMLTCG